MFKLKLDERLNKKKDLDFTKISETFQKHGINSEEKAKNSQHVLLKNAVLQSITLIVICSALSLIIRPYTQVILLFLCLGIFYLGIYAFRSRKFLQRYIDEVIKHPNFNPETGSISNAEGSLYAEGSSHAESSSHAEGSIENEKN